MIIHIALFGWKAGVSAQEIEKAMADVRALRSKIKGLHEIYCGENFSKWNEGYTHAVVVLAADQSALQTYRDHPDHKEVASRIDRMEAKSVGVDFSS